MKVKFANTDVDLWRLRVGEVVVLMYDDGVMDPLHIKSFHNRSILNKHEMTIIAGDEEGDYEFKPEWLTWVGSH
jgi:hypothetical protein